MKPQHLDEEELRDKTHGWLEEVGYRVGVGAVERYAFLASHLLYTLHYQSQYGFLYDY